ncbi:hypothetical protein ES703_108552 [subsurface metagenome]
MTITIPVLIIVPLLFIILAFEIWLAYFLFCIYKLKKQDSHNAQRGERK